MLKDMRIGAKLGLGFGLVIVLALLVGGIGIFNLLAISEDATNLEDRELPQLRIATSVETSAWQMVYAIRGYTYSYDRRFFDQGMGYMDAMDAYIRQGQQLLQEFPDLVTFRRAIEQAVQGSQRYRQETQETNQIMNRILLGRESIRQNTQALQQLMGEYVDNLHVLMAQDLSGGGPLATLLRRNTNIQRANSVLDSLNQIVITSNQIEIDQAYARFSEVVVQIPGLIQALDELIAGTVLQSNINRLTGIRTATVNLQNAIVSLDREYGSLVQINAARIASGELITRTMSELARTEVEEVQEAAAEMVELVVRAITLMTIVLVLAVLFAIVIAFVLTKMITSALLKSVEFAKVMAQGDMTQTLDIDQKDEIGQLGSAMKEMASKITSIVQEIQAGAQSVGQGSNEMSFSAQQVAEGATEQAASTEEVSSSMEEMSANIRQNAESAAQTNTMSQKVAQNAKEGGEAVNETVNAMKEIAQKINIIEEIARNTNLLALNAAIEAARAGEQGRGFAVVASEVRKLAERSQKAAGEISELSQRSVAVAERAGKLITEMIPDIGRTAELIQEITVASREQDSGADQINRALVQLDQVIQQNASFSEEMAATAEGLASQADQLQQAVGFFKTRQSTQRKSQPALPAPGANHPRSTTIGPKQPQKQSTTVPSKPASLHKPKGGSVVSSSKSAAQPTKGIKLELPVGEVEDIDDNFDEF
jgi:methyl-accepting chemotaxis protein